MYAAAFESGIVAPADVVYDAPLLVEYGRDEYWLPSNDGGEYQGPVTVQRVLERSLNPPAVRIALATGIDHVRDLAAHAGLLSSTAEAVPSLALGAVVWAGRDDDTNAGYYGSQAALPLWTGYMLAVRPGAGFPNWDQRADDGGTRQETVSVESVLRPERAEWAHGEVVADAVVEEPTVGRALFLERFELWKDHRSALAGTTRILEVPSWFRLPCPQPRKEPIEDNPCIG